MLFNMYLATPFMIFTILCLCISAKAGILESVMYVILGIALCAFSTAWGCVCGVKHMRLDWENEVEVIKQGTAVMIYMFPNMFICMGLVVLTVVLGLRMSHELLTLIFILITAILAALSYMRVMALAKKN
jgi:ABC-2 type transport system permease protein